MINKTFWKAKKIIITGHTGFKGSWLSLWLSQLGADVLGYALNPTDPGLYTLLNLDNKITSKIGDIRDLENLKKVFYAWQPEIVIHMAAQSLVRTSYEKPIETYETNVLGTINVFEASLKCENIKAVINVTSDKVYENNNSKQAFSENAPLGGLDPYSNSKVCAEHVTTAYRQSFFLPNKITSRKIGLASARSGNVVGGGDWAKDRLIPDCIRSFLQTQPALIRNPHSIRPWQHVLDPLYGYLLLAQALYSDPVRFSKGWNFGPDYSSAKTVAWMADYIVKIWNEDVSWKDEFSESGISESNYEAKYLSLDSDMAQKELKWFPFLKIEEALLWVVEWYKCYSQNGAILDKTMNQINLFEKLIMRAGC